MTTRKPIVRKPKSPERNQAGKTAVSGDDRKGRYRSPLKLSCIIVLISLSLNVMAQDIATDVIINGNISRLDNVLEPEAIANLNKRELRILRNTIFAKHGYIFASNDLREHFSKFAWYNGVNINVQDRLTETDRMNVAIIQSREIAIDATIHNNVREYNDETDFNVRVIDDGKAIEISRYYGTKNDVHIPPRIQNLPVTVIGENMFNAKKITSVTIPDTVTHIESFAFEGNQLTSVELPRGLISISYGAFLNNRLTSVTIPNTVTYIGERAFARNQLASVTIPVGVTRIGASAFEENQLTSVTIPRSVTHIWSGAFRNNQLTSVIIPNPKTYIADDAFDSNVRIIRRRF